MNVEQFVRRRQEGWHRLGDLVAAARNRPERLATTEVLELGNLYRAAVGDLAQLRTHHPNDPSTQRLGQLVVAARQLVYGGQRTRSRLTDVVLREYWRRIAEKPAFVVVALLALLVPAALGMIWVTGSPTAATGIVPGQFESVLTPGPEGTDQGMTAAEQVEFSAVLFTNNTRVAILSFALGILLCVGSVLIVALNGLILGVIAGFLVSNGDGGFFVELAAAHGILEISCIVVAAAAGIRVGWAIVDPGRQPRAVALRNEARATVVIVVGTAAWLAVAALIESFVSRRGFSAAPMAVVGILIGSLYWFLVWRAARSQAGERLGSQIGADASVR